MVLKELGVEGGDRRHDHRAATVRSRACSGVWGVGFGLGLGTEWGVGREEAYQCAVGVQVFESCAAATGARTQTSGRDAKPWPSHQSALDARQVFDFSRDEMTSMKG